MAKITISRIVETSRALATKSGQELQDIIQFIADLAEQVLRNLRNGLTFADNINCKIATYSLTQGVNQVIDQGDKTPVGVVVWRVFSTAHGIDSFQWYLDTNNKVNIKATFTGSPTSPLDTTIVIFFG